MSRKPDRQPDKDNSGADRGAQQPHATVTPMVTGLPIPPKQRATSRALDGVSPAQVQPRKKRKKKVVRQPCIVPGIHRLFTVKETASYLRLSPWTVRGLGWNGEIPEVKIGRRTLFDQKDLDAFIDRSKRR